DTSFRPAGVPFLDLGTEWKAFTGRPFVYALWAHGPGHPKAAEIAATLRQAKARGTAKIPEIARREAKRLGLTPKFCGTYLTELGEGAHAIRRRLHPENVATYIVDRNINYTNTCITYCKFCAFYRPPGHPEEYTLSKEAMAQKIKETKALGGVQILLQGGHH